MGNRTSGNHPLPLELLVDADGNPWCDPPDRCPACSLLAPHDGESWERYLARLGALFRAAPPIRRNQHR